LTILIASHLGVSANTGGQQPEVIGHFHASIQRVTSDIITDAVDTMSNLKQRVTRLENSLLDDRKATIQRWINEAEEISKCPHGQLPEWYDPHPDDCQCRICLSIRSAEELFKDQSI
jgi:hypothetical protein